MPALRPRLGPWWRPDRESIGVAAFSAAWAALFSVTAPATTYLTVPLVFVGVVLLRRLLLVGASLVLAATIMTLVAGAPYGNVDMVAAIAFTLFSAGRMLRSVTIGLLLTLGFALASAGRDGLALGDLAVSGAVFTAMWTSGVLVRRRARQARAALAELERLAGEDLAELTAERVAAERGRLADDALIALRTAVVEMRWTAAAAIDDPVPLLVREIQDRGRRAVEELRELLGLLRDGPGTGTGAGAESGIGEQPEVPPTASVDRTNLAVAAFLAVGLAAGALVADGWITTPGVVAGQVATVLAVATRGRAPTVACTIALIGTLAAALDPPEDPESLLPLTLGYCLLCWTVTSGVVRRRALLALLALGLAGGVLGSRFGAEGVGFVFVAFTTPYLAGLAWHERARIEQDAVQRSTVLRLQREARAAAALRAERLRLARELHDVTSHAVGVMVMQAGAAQALLERDPPRALEALDRVREAGDGALDEIANLFGVLGTEESGQGGPDPTELRPALLELVARMRVAGLAIEVRLAGLPEDPEQALTVYRLVQEGLTNALRHAAGARVLVEAGTTAEGVRVRVSDDGGKARPAPSRGSVPVGGFGLTGLAERLQACGGALEVHRPPAGGFVLTGHLPAAGAHPLANQGRA